MSEFDPGEKGAAKQKDHGSSLWNGLRSVGQGLLEGFARGVAGPGQRAGEPIHRKAERHDRIGGERRAAAAQVQRSLKAWRERDEEGASDQRASDQPNHAQDKQPNQLPTVARAVGVHRKIFRSGTPGPTKDELALRINRVQRTVAMKGLSGLYDDDLTLARDEIGKATPDLAGIKSILDQLEGKMSRAEKALEGTEESPGLTGGPSRTIVKRVHIGNTDWRVDIEMPVAGSTGNCHVQGKKGAYDGTKKYMSSVGDLSQLPGSVANNAEIRAGVIKGLAVLATLRANA